MRQAKQLLLCGLIAFSISAKAQDHPRKNVDEATKSKALEADTSKKGPWKIGGTIAFNLRQQNSSNWIGVNEKFALTVGANVDIYANGSWSKNAWDNTLKASYGYQNNETQGLRKTADFFDLYSKYGRALNDKKTLFASLIFNLRSQFSDGYDYEKTPRRRTSDFFAPANILLTPGLDWKPTGYFSLFFSPVAAKWIIVSNDPYSYSTNPPPPGEKPISELYGVDPEKKVDAQFGAFLSASFNKDILKNVNYSSRLDLYSNYLRNPENIDIFWTNSLTFKVNNWLAFGYNWNIAYDDDYVAEGVSGPRTQFLGTFGIGITGKF